MTDTPENQTDQTVPNAPVTIHAQYIKDLSFENPHAPKSFQGQGENPNMDLNIEIEVQKMEEENGDNIYEVALKINASATRTDHTMFILELSYAAFVSINAESKHHHPLLFVDVPHTIFPFARQIISDMTQSGGYIPLLLNPVDFKSMYFQRFAENGEKVEETDKDSKESGAA